MSLCILVSRLEDRMSTFVQDLQFALRHVRPPEQLVVLSAAGKAWEGHIGDRGAGADKSFSYPMYRDLRDQAKVFDGLIATTQASVGISYGRVSEPGDAEVVGGNYFSVL